MTTNYDLLRDENKTRYGTDIGRIGQMLLAERYDDRTHFIFELLQNAEDALGRRQSWTGSRAVKFELAEKELKVSHFGKPFDGADVRAICGIGESTKNLGSIGRFGIGFKSVYAFTKNPMVHSGVESFGIESYVWPYAVPDISRGSEETAFVIPLEVNAATAKADISKGLRRLGPRSLLFLNQINEITWDIEGGSSGLYMRENPEKVGAIGRKVELVGEEQGKSDIEETWLLFSREVKTDEGVVVGCVEIGFQVKKNETSDKLLIVPVNDSHLVVFFPTVVSTNLGFLVQGPYLTTPSRDNLLRDNPWNQHLSKETSVLLIDALKTLKKEGLLDVEAIRSLPIDRSKFSDDKIFVPLFASTCKALKFDYLLPSSNGDHIPAVNAKLSRTKELRDLFDSCQLGDLFGSSNNINWLSGEITQDKTPDLRSYLMRELDVQEVTPELIVGKLSVAFLEKQTDDWTRRLYEFLNGQTALLREGKLKNIPLVRLQNGMHVTAKMDGDPQAFLPGEEESGFPTVHREVCSSDDSINFLRGLGLSEPDPVDDVIANLLGKYRDDEIEVDDVEYSADIQKILNAFKTDSQSQKDRLVLALSESSFVLSVDMGDGENAYKAPGEVYIATEKLKSLFVGVPNVFIVDDKYTCLKGEEIRSLLETCGASRYLKPIPVGNNRFSRQQLAEMRKRGGCEKTNGYAEELIDYSFLGLKELLLQFSKLDSVLVASKSSLLWESLCDVEEQRRKASAFRGIYKWHYHRYYTFEFDATVIDQLRFTDWVPDSKGEVSLPSAVEFSSLKWKPNPFLLSKIQFKPPIIDALAREVGIEPAVFELLKKLGVTNEAELRAHLRVDVTVGNSGVPSAEEVEDAIGDLLGDAPMPTQPVHPPVHGLAGGENAPAVDGEGSGCGGGEQPGSGGGSGGGKRSPGSEGGRPFISYVGAHPSDSEDSHGTVPDGLDQAARMAIEEKAIQMILAREPQLQRTPTGNQGFDLVEHDDNGIPVRWVEVKAMTGGLTGRSVGLSRAQFKWAGKHGAAFWLYVVENTDDEDVARIVKIQDPVGKSKTFTFDEGWLKVAALELASDHFQREE